MTDHEIALLALKVANDTTTWVAVIGAVGVLIGVILTVVGNLAIEWLRNRDQKAIDRTRQKMLRQMLEDKTFQWRSLSTLAAVIGCSDEQTRNHLIAIGARGSETDSGMWGLLSRHPLEDIDRQKD